MAAVAAVLAAKERIAERDQDPSENTQQQRLNRVSNSFNPVARGASRNLFVPVTYTNVQGVEEIGPSSSDQVSGGLSSERVSSYVHQMPDARCQTAAIAAMGNARRFKPELLTSRNVQSPARIVNATYS
jgi:hypothetical protein